MPIHARSREASLGCGGVYLQRCEENSNTLNWVQEKTSEEIGSGGVIPHGMVDADLASDLLYGVQLIEDKFGMDHPNLGDMLNTMGIANLLPSNLSEQRRCWTSKHRKGNSEHDHCILLAQLGRMRDGDSGRTAGHRTQRKWFYGVV
ncbi:hypothetical protein SELMODRAFT_431326 [Selaginella moellendorffii]|uniref:Uncharacterized protein n=1 Tax=Selaginella moellendorffii TaxID=88036 RepID=D8TC84_SELML|nr:hypothetical protein SELMODRAFT_431326 [Selaginella moellendorffii]